MYISLLVRYNHIKTQNSASTRSLNLFPSLHRPKSRQDCCPIFYHILRRLSIYDIQVSIKNQAGCSNYQKAVVGASLTKTTITQLKLPGIWNKEKPTGKSSASLRQYCTVCSPSIEGSPFVCCLPHSPSVWSSPLNNLAICVDWLHRVEAKHVELQNFSPSNNSRSFHSHFWWGLWR